VEFFFLALLVVFMASALATGYPVAFALPGSAILTIGLAALLGYLSAGDVDAFFVHGGPAEWLSTGVTNFRGVYWVIERDILIAIPLFVFMGLMLQQSKIAEDLLSAMAQLFGSIPGGLGISVIFVGALLAATTGIVGATVVAMGMISLPAMLRNNYSKPLSSGIIAASGTLGQILPPSIVLLILVDQLTAAVNQASTERRALYKTSSGEFLMPGEFDVVSVSAGELFMGAFVPGLVLVGLYMLYVLGCAFFRPDLAPTVPHKGNYDRQFALKVFLALVPPLVLIFLVLGSIITGVATVNQAGAIGSAGAIIMAGYRLHRGKRGAYFPTVLALLSLLALGVILNVFTVNLRRIETPEDSLGVNLAAIASVLLAIALAWSIWRTLKIDQTMKRVVEATTHTTALVFAILLGAVMFTAAFRGFGGEELVRDFLRQLPGGFWAQFALVMLIIFILGFFLDYIEITVIVVPIVAPILLADPSANITAIWLGIMIGLNIQTSFLTPPFGFALFYLRGVAPPAVKTTDIYKGVVPFIAIQLLMLGLVGAYPALVNYLPNRVSLLSDNAPPTTYPRLQYCAEEYAARALIDRGAVIRAAIGRMQSYDLQQLPPTVRRELSESFEKAINTFTLMKRIKATEQIVQAAAPAYSPQLRLVRGIERDIRRVDKETSALAVVLSRVGGVTTETEERAARRRTQVLLTRREELLLRMPAGWKATNKKFYKLQKAENDARRAYRRNTSDAYETLAGTIATISGAMKLASLEAELRGLEPLLLSRRKAAGLEHIKALSRAFRKIGMTTGIVAALKAARQSLRAGKPDFDGARMSLEKAIALFETEVAWRRRAARELLPALKTYEKAIADTIGLRGQPRFPDNVALEIAQCSATPRDIQLHF
jgi:tripartite ATP-independent transporter DctM subunit